jgi:hypothetical protein
LPEYATETFPCDQPFLSVMTQRSTPRGILDLSDLSYLDEMVVDKRTGQRSAAKKNRRNRHYEKQFIRNSLAQGLLLARTEPLDMGQMPATETSHV